MKRILLLFSILTIMKCVSAQTDDYSKYLNNALEKIELGDCDAAQKYYNVYKELTGKSVASVEVLLAECGIEPTYKVGDYIEVDREKYQVAYIRDGGKHGLAVLEIGWCSLSTREIEKKTIPTWDELNQIYANRDALGLYEIYWSNKNRRFNFETKCKAMDFSTGKDYWFSHRDSRAKKLLIYRF
jgi:hypothetical protein